MLTLGIETTCDETAIAIVDGETEILSNKIASQADVHSIYGGVIPEMASRLHTEMFIPLLKECLKETECTLNDIDIIGVAYGPGLLGSLLVGLNGAKSLAYSLNKPLYCVNHVEAHLYSSFMSSPSKVTFPCIGVVLSGGHTSLLKVNSVGNYEMLGETVDDAIGEAFDKVAKMMHLPYPGGPEIEKIATFGDPDKYPFKGGRIKNRPYSFSFSGLKTKVLYTLFGQNGSIEKVEIPEQMKNDVAAAFQRAAFEDVISKTLRACEEFKCSTVLFGGGVTNNRTLRHLFMEADPTFNYIWPHGELTLDNGAMIAGLAAWRCMNGVPPSPLDTKPITRMPFC